MSQNFFPKLFTSVSLLVLSRILLGSFIVASTLSNGAFGMNSDSEQQQTSPGKQKSAESEEDLGPEDGSPPPRKNKQVTAEEFDVDSFQKKYESLTDLEGKFNFLNDAALSLSEEAAALRVNYMWDLAPTDGPPSTVRYNALRWLGANNVQDEEKKAKARPLVFKILAAEDVPLSERFELMHLCKTIPFSILFSFFKQISAIENPEERTVLEQKLVQYGAHFFDAVVIDFSQQEEIKNSFLNFPEVFFQSFTLSSFLRIWAPYYVENDPQGKVKILTMLSQAIIASKDPGKTIDLIRVYLKIGKNLGETDYDRRLWANLQKAEEKSQLGSISQASRLILEYSHDLGLKQDVTAWLIQKAQGKASTDDLFFACKCLKTLIQYGDQKVKVWAVKLCKDLINDERLDMDDLRTLVNALKTLPEGQNLKDRIFKERVIPRIHKYIKETPQAEGQYENSNKSEEELDLASIQMLLSAPDIEVQQDAFSYFKNILIGRNNDEEPQEAADMVVQALGADHPLAQEVVQLMIARDLGDDPRSAYGTYRLLLEKRKGSVVYRPESLELADGRFITFHLNTLKNRRERTAQVPLVKHSQFIALAEALVKEVQENPGISNSYNVYAPNVAVSTLLYTAKDTFFQQLLDGDDATTPKANISRINLKLYPS